MMNAEIEKDFTFLTSIHFENKFLVANGLTVTRGSYGQMGSGGWALLMRIEIIIIAAPRTPGPRHDAQNRRPPAQLSPGRDIP